MNKRLFVLICSIILFQYAINSSECETATKAEDDESFTCDNKATSADNKRCVAKGTHACEEKDIPCNDANLNNPTDDFCRKLTITEGDSHPLKL